MHCGGQNLVRAQWVNNDPNKNNVALGKTNAYGLGYEFAREGLPLLGQGSFGHAVDRKSVV